MFDKEFIQLESVLSRNGLKGTFHGYFPLAAGSDGASDCNVRQAWTGILAQTTVSVHLNKLLQPWSAAGGNDSAHFTELCWGRNEITMEVPTARATRNAERFQCFIPRYPHNNPSRSEVLLSLLSEAETEAQMSET